MTDLLIVGGGIMGLWAGVMAERAGLSTLIVERDRIGAGASGGILGVLMPHMPDRWNPKKQFQLDALVSLEAEIATIEAATGLSAGYRRCGRIMPLGKPHLRDIAPRHEQEALINWSVGNRQFHWHVQDHIPAAGWPDTACAPHGVICDTLAARVAPRALLFALTAYLRASKHVRVVEGMPVVAIDPATRRVTFADGSIENSCACIIAAGPQSFPMLESLVPLEKGAGIGVKGQAALLDARVDPSLPIIFSDGLYIVPHENGHVAIGSTSEEEYAAPFTTDEKLDNLLSRARDMVPALRDAPVIERWAGLRPKAIGRDPMAGPVPDLPGIHMLTGGFKISFGIAHRLAEAVVAGVAGGDGPGMPPSFACAAHLR